MIVEKQQLIMFLTLNQALKQFIRTRAQIILCPALIELFYRIFA